MIVEYYKNGTIKMIPSSFHDVIVDVCFFIVLWKMYNLTILVPHIEINISSCGYIFEKSI